MNEILKESNISLKYIKVTFGKISEVLQSQLTGVIANPQIIPVSFNVSFFSFHKSKFIVSVTPINGEFQSKLEHMKRNGYINMNYSFKIQTSVLLAKGLIRIKIIDTAFVKKEKKYPKHKLSSV